MRPIRELLNEALAYTEAYMKKYGLTLEKDADLLVAIYDQHLTYLINRCFSASKNPA
jgi:hypothetical protein